MMTFSNTNSNTMRKYFASTIIVLMMILASCTTIQLAVPSDPNGKIMYAKVTEGNIKETAHVAFKNGDINKGTEYVVDQSVSAVDILVNKADTLYNYPVYQKDAKGIVILDFNGKSVIDAKATADNRAMATDILRLVLDQLTNIQKSLKDNGILK